MIERTGEKNRRDVLRIALAGAATAVVARSAGGEAETKPGLSLTRRHGANDEGFRPLFDGKSFEGWKVNENTPKSWKIDDELLVLTGGNSHLFTREEFDDFVVRLEWRPLKSGYDSGFFVRGRQIQMAQGGAGMLFGSREAKATPQLHKPPGEWNRWEVSCVGTKLSLTVNGTLAWQIDDFPLARRPLGIQAEGHPIEFRNLWVKSLSQRNDK
jgi:hypothetical protein